MIPKSYSFVEHCGIGHHGYGVVVLHAAENGYKHGAHGRTPCKKGCFENNLIIVYFVK
jgi:hypothetical protein